MIALPTSPVISVCLSLNSILPERWRRCGVPESGFHEETAVGCADQNASVEVRSLPEPAMVSRISVSA